MNAVEIEMEQCRLGVSTVDRTSHIYGTVIRVPYTVPADVWCCDYRNRYTAGGQPYFAVF